MPQRVINPEVGMRFGRYELLERIGAGGMGEVYHAHDLVLGRDVAVKLLPEAYASSPARLASFAREARTTSSLNHPNIVTVHDVGQARGRQFIVTELVDGTTLRQLLRAEGRLPLRQVLDFGVQMAEGLARAHAAGIVHRDLKPENIMVTADGRVKVLDFGIAKLQTGPTPETVDVDPSDWPTWPGGAEAHLSVGDGPVVGTLGYVSPEQARGLAVDHRSDQFALGAILYEMATGRRAFQGEDPSATVSAIVSDEPTPLGRLRPELPAPARWVIERCLAKDPAQRYASTVDLARAIRCVRDHLPELVDDRRPSASPVTRVFRRPTAGGPGVARRVAGVTAALVLVGLGLFQTEPRVRALWHSTAGLSASGWPGGATPANVGPPLERVSLRWTLEAPPEGAPIVVEGGAERWAGEVRITARLVAGGDGEDAARLAPEVLALATALAEVLGRRGEAATSSRHVSSLRGPDDGFHAYPIGEGDPRSR